MNSNEDSIAILTFGGDANHWKSVVNSCAPDSRVTSSPTKKDLPKDLESIECLVGLNFPDELFARLPNLKWIQNLAVGVENLLVNPHISLDVRITNTAHLYGDAVSEFVIWAMLTLSRQFHTVIRNQEKRRWRQIPGTGLMGKTVGIVGLGDIGRRVAHQATALSLRTIGFVRDEGGAPTDDIVDVICPVSHLSSQIAGIDVLVLCLPLTTETAGLISSDIVARMKKSAILINVSRNGLIDQTAVVNAISDGRIAGAAFDVFDKEPLRWWSALWKTRNLLVTPHTAALTVDYKTRVADLLCENMVRFLDGRPLLNEVDRSKGY